MANYCQGCGGVLGRDCWNEIECISITNSMYFQDKIQPLKNKIENLEINLLISIEAQAFYNTFKNG